MKILVLLGTRPEVIKMAPVIHALREAGVETLLCSTGQHREMLQQALDVFALVPDLSLEVMSSGQSLNALSSKLLLALDQVMESLRPDWVLVQGDTTTAFCGALAAFHRGIKIAHVEAGLRTGDLNSPFPEEANRSLLARIAHLHFAPTQRAREALLREGIDAKQICVVGNTVVDAILIAKQLPGFREKRAASISAHEGPLILVTCHRRENFGGVLEGICQSLRRLCERYPEYHWVFPVHLNPQVQEPVHRILQGLKNLSLLEPLDYLSNLALISRAVLLVTDSGGLQEEAPSFGVPVVVMRNHTERFEGVEAGLATLAGQDPKDIEKAIIAWLENPSAGEALKKKANPYGDGFASKRIAQKLCGQAMEEFHG